MSWYSCQSTDRTKYIGNINTQPTDQENTRDLQGASTSKKTKTPAKAKTSKPRAKRKSVSSPPSKPPKTIKKEKTKKIKKVVNADNFI